MKAFLSATASLAIALLFADDLAAAEADLSGAWRIGNAGTQRFLRGAPTGKQYVTTQSFADDDFATFVLKRLPSGAYTIHCKGNGKALQVDSFKDRVLSTRPQVQRDLAVFAFDRQVDNTFRIRVKASRRFINNDSTSNLISTFDQADTPFSRFVLFEPKSTPKNMVVVDIAALPRPVLAGAPPGSTPGLAGPPGSSPPAPPAIPSTPPAPAPSVPSPAVTMTPTPSAPAPSTPTTTGGGANPFLPSSPFAPTQPMAPAATPTTPAILPTPAAGGTFPGAASLPGVIPAGRNRPIHPLVVYDALVHPEDGEQPAYTQVPLDVMYGNESAYPYANGAVLIENGWVVFREPKDNFELGYKFEVDDRGIMFFGLVGENEDDPNTILAAQILKKAIRINGKDTAIEIFDILGLASDDPAVDLAPARKTDSGGRPINPVIFNFMLAGPGGSLDPMNIQVPMPTIHTIGNAFPDRFVTTEGNRVTYRENPNDYTAYTFEDLGNGVTRYNLEMTGNPGTIHRATIDARIIPRTINYSDKEHSIDVLDVVAFTSEKSAPLLALLPAAVPAPSIAPAPAPAPKAPAPSPPAIKVPAKSPTLPKIVPVKSKIRTSDSIKLVTYANFAREKYSLTPLAWSDEVAAYAQGVADHLAGIFANEREALQFKNRFQSREGENFPLDYGPPNPEPGLPAHSAFFYDRRPAKPDDNLPPYGIVIEIHPADYVTPPGKTVNSYPDRYQWNPERVITPSSPATPLTQLIWRDSRHIGCGVTQKADYHITVICFDPAGNVIGGTPY